MKTYLNLITIFAILVLVQGCKTQNVVGPPVSDEVISIMLKASLGWGGEIQTKITKDSIWYVTDGRIIPIDSAIVDTQEFIPLVSSFDVSTFWSLEDNIEKIGSDGPLFIITVTARQASPTNAKGNIVEKKLQFTDIHSYPSLSSLWAKLDTLNNNLQRRLR